MPVSSDILKLSLSLAINNTPTGFWGKLIQSMNENQGAITGAVGILTLFVLGFQLWVMNRQANISERANEISREVAFLPTQEKALWEWISKSEELISLLQKIMDITTEEIFSALYPDEQKQIKLEVDKTWRSIIKDPDKHIQGSSNKASFFVKNKASQEIKKWSSGGTANLQLNFFLNKMPERSCDLVGNEKIFTEANHLRELLTKSREEVEKTLNICSS